MSMHVELSTIAIVEFDIVNDGLQPGNYVSVHIEQMKLGTTNGLCSAGDMLNTS